MKKAATATTTTTAPSPRRSAALSVLTSPRFVDVCAALMQRQPNVRLGQVNKATHALANDAGLMNGLWKRLYEKDWSRKWKLEAEAVFAAGAEGAEGASEDEAAATTTTTTTITTAPSWKALYINRHELTHNQPTDFLQRLGL